MRAAYGRSRFQNFGFAESSVVWIWRRGVRACYRVDSQTLTELRFGGAASEKQFWAESRLWIAKSVWVNSPVDTHLKVKRKKRPNASLKKRQISYTMSRVRSSGSKIETLLGRALWRAGLRY